MSNAAFAASSPDSALEITHTCRWHGPCFYLDQEGVSVSLRVFRIVLARIVIALSLAACIALGPSPAMSQANRPVAAPSLPATDRAAADVSRLERARVQKLSEKRMLERAYEAQLRELDRLKRSRASWNRDRQIRSNKAESQSTAARLSRADGELRTIDELLRRQRRALLAAIDREAATRPSPTRQAALDRMRAQVTAALKPRVRKILVPDDTLDEMADPEELTEQIALIQQAEAELRREREALRQREDRYVRMARLRQLRDRATEMSELEEEVGRRTGRAGGRTSVAGQGDRGEAAGDPGSSPDYTGAGGDDGLASPGDGDSGGPGGGFNEDGGFEQSSILLTDVVDSGTIDALRRAGRSSSPGRRADAAARARKQVEARLQRLERSRAIIQRHLGMLRQGK